jgi:hypothetical protein
MPDPQLPFPILYTDKFVRTSVYKSIVGEHVVVLCVGRCHSKLGIFHIVLVHFVSCSNPDIVRGRI